MPGAKPHTIVVGAGIIGASIAWHLVRGGAKVTIIDAASPGGVASPCSFGWINSTHGFPKPYFDLRCHSMADWQRLAGEVPNLPVRWTGTLYLCLDGLDSDDTALAGFVHSHTQWGYAIELLDGSAAGRFAPNLLDPPDVMAWASQEGVAEAEQTAQILVDGAIVDGAQLMSNVRVDGLSVSGGRVTGARIAGRVISADEVIVAAGVGTPDIVRDVGYDVPLNAPPGLLIHTEPHAPLLGCTLLSPDVHVRQRSDGVVIAGWDFSGSVGNQDLAEGGRQIMAALGKLLNGGRDLRLDRAVTGYRPTPQDGFPIVGRCPGVTGLYLAVMHSGVTLAPAVGKFTADEILNGQSSPLLAPYGPERFTN